MFLLSTRTRRYHPVLRLLSGDVGAPLPMGRSMITAPPQDYVALFLVLCMHVRSNSRLIVVKKRPKVAASPIHTSPGL